jgi:hypothetical protein
VDETFIAVPAQVLADVVADPSRWRRWWPDLELTVFMDRGVAGQRWSMVGALVGSSEIWLEPALDGTTLHYYLRGTPAGADRTTGVDLPDSPAGWRRADAIRRRRALDWKRHVWAVKDELEGGRRAGEPVTPAAAGSATAHGDPGHQ